MRQSRAWACLAAGSRAFSLKERSVILALDTFPANPTMALPPFNPHGSLPPGDYAPTREGFEAHFVKAGNQSVRLSIYQGWIKHREALAAAGLAHSARQLLNGSFTTAKNAPGDIDIAVEVPVADLDQIDTHPAADLLQGPDMKPEYRCDAYPIYCLPVGHVHYEAVTAAAIRYGTKWFGTDRQGNPKGRVWATVGGLQ